MKKVYQTLALLAFTIFGFAQNALDFDGSNDHVQTTATGITGTSARTIEAWIKTTGNYNPSNGGTQGVLVDWGSMTLGQRFTFNLLWANSVRVEVGGNGISGTTAVNDGLWHHVAVVYDPSQTTKVYLYIDGQLETSGNFAGVTMNTVSTPIRIGRRVDNAKYFDGSIDEVRVWNVARTATEISNAMDDEFCTIPTGLIAYYKMNHGTAGGTNSADSIAVDAVAANNGSLKNFALSGSSSNWVLGKSLTVGNTQDSVAITACDSYTPPSGNVTWTTSGNYIDTSMTSAGCDSILFIDLTVLPNSTGSLTTTACNTYTSPSGNNTWTTSGTYTDIVPNSVGCDSVITINLTINTVDTNVLVNNATLTSWQAGANYQWLDCDNGYAPISGATGQTFSATANGHYAVEIDLNGCVDTSACYAINGIGMDENLLSRTELFPNPADELLTIDFGQLIESAHLEIINMTGSTVQSFTVTRSESFTIELDIPAGIYFIRLQTGDKTAVKRFSKM